MSDYSRPRLGARALMIGAAVVVVGAAVVVVGPADVLLPQLEPHGPVEVIQP